MTDDYVNLLAHRKRFRVIDIEAGNIYKMEKDAFKPENNIVVINKILDICEKKQHNIIKRRLRVEGKEGKKNENS